MLAPFDCNYNYILENERVRLEPLNGNNSTQLLHFALNEPNIWTFSLIPMSGEKNFKKYIADALFCREYCTCYPFMVFDKTDMAPQGILLVSCGNKVKLL